MRPMRSGFTPYLGPWGPLPAGGLGTSKTLRSFAANHGKTYRGRALLVKDFQRLTARGGVGRRATRHAKCKI